MNRGTKLDASPLFFVYPPSSAATRNAKLTSGFSRPRQIRIGVAAFASPITTAPLCRKRVSSDTCRRVYCLPLGTAGKGREMEPPTICMPLGIQSVCPFLKQAAILGKGGIPSTHQVGSLTPHKSYPEHPQADALSFPSR